MRRSDELEPDDRDRRIDGAQPPEPKRTGIRPRYVVIVLFAIVLIAFAIANFRPVGVSFLLFETRARLVTVIVVAAALGFVIGYFTGRPTRLQRKWLRKREEDQTG
ncbi:MAG: LapA family protein [Actinomycetota bacterium]